jgi:hypothetical protein
VRHARRAASRGLEEEKKKIRRQDPKRQDLTGKAENQAYVPDFSLALTSQISSQSSASVDPALARYSHSPSPRSLDTDHPSDPRKEEEEADL